MTTMLCKLPISSIAPMANKVVRLEKKNVAPFLSQPKYGVLKVQNKKKVEKTKAEVAIERIEKKIEDCRARRTKQLEKKKQLVRNLRNNRVHAVNKIMQEEKLKKAMQGPKETHQIEKIEKVIHENKEVLEKFEKREKVMQENKEVLKFEKIEREMQENKEVPKTEKFEKIKKVMQENEELVPKIEKFEKFEKIEKVIQENKEVPKIENVMQGIKDVPKIEKIEKIEKVIQENKEVPEMEKNEKSPDFINLGFEEAFSDNYAPFDFITKGNIATVYKARSTKDHQAPFVAVKIINKSEISDEIAMSIKMEVDLLAALNDHPDTVDFYGAYEDDKLIYIVIELLERGDLYHELKLI